MDISAQRGKILCRIPPKLQVIVSNNASSFYINVFKKICPKHLMNCTINFQLSDNTFYEYWIHIVI